MSVPVGSVDLTTTERVILGRRVADALAEEVERLKAGRVFLLASRSLNRNTDEIEQVRKALGARFAGVYDGMPPHAPRSAVIEATAQARAAGTDLIVGIGGGSIIDAAKIVALCLEHDLRTPESMEPFHIYVNEAGEVVKPVFRGPSIRVINVPTTLSGGEFNALSGSTDETIKHKQGYEHPLMAPISVILDPALGLHTPEWLWLSTGVRSVDHAIETLGSFQSNDFCDGMAECALRLLSAGLPRVKANPHDLEARLKCQIGVWQSMIPVIGGIPMGASHAIGHILGGTCDVPHGHCSCVMAPYVLAFNEPVNGERQQRISAAFGQPGKRASEIVDGFIRGLGMPRRLSEVGVGADRLQQVAEYTMLDLWARTNPRTIAGPDDVMQILRLAA